MSSVSEDPSLSALSAVLERISALKEELEAAENAVRNQAGPEEEDDDDELMTKASKKIRTQYNFLTKEIALLKKSVPEGLPEDEEFQYFLAVAELQRNIEELKTYAMLSESNLRSVLDQVQLTQNLILDEENMNDALRKKASSADARKAQSTKPKSDQEQQLERKIRATKMVYKELKSFLGELLENIFRNDQIQGDPGPHLLGQFIQNLWNTFTQEGPPAYLKMSHLEHDVNPGDVAWLVEYGIVETNPEDKDQVRLINFTE